MNRALVPVGSRRVGEVEVMDTPFPDGSGDLPALILEPSGVSMTYSELDARSCQVAHMLREAGIEAGQCIALVMENRAEFLVCAWAAQRTGLHYVGVNTHLTSAEAQYIIDDSGASAVIVSELCSELVALSTDEVTVFHIGPNVRVDRVRFDPSHFPETAPENQSEGDFLLYSSGTTGRPKGIERDLAGGPLGTYVDHPGAWLSGLLGFEPGDIYLCPAPLYHAAPLGWSMAVQRLGGTVVVMEKFDAAHALELIELHRVTHSQWVPTMFVRMLKLAEPIRAQFDLSSHRVAIHAAAPCPVSAKRQMIQWWGAILFEFYSSTEGMGATAIRSDEWLRKPGSVGRPLLGTPEILDDEGNSMSPNEIGTVWFSGGVDFRYRGDPGKTAAARDLQSGRSSVGDVGYLDEDGFLFLSDRRAHLVISGGVNIYPQEIENVLVMHPAVLDVAVVGVPDEDMGERLVAVVQPTGPADTAVVEALVEYCRANLAGYKVPREVRFVESLPRTPTGKLRKHELVIG